MTFGLRLAVTDIQMADGWKKGQSVVSINSESADLTTSNV
jgi:hypothetical protein